MGGGTNRVTVGCWNVLHCFATVAEIALSPGPPIVYGPFGWNWRPLQFSYGVDRADAVCQRKVDPSETVRDAQQCGKMKDYTKVS